MKPARIQTPLGRLLVAEGRKMTWLADQIGASKQQVGLWVHGVHVPAEPTRVKIANALGQTVEDLWPETESQAA